MRLRLFHIVLLLATSLLGTDVGPVLAASPAYLLKSAAAPGDVSVVSVRLEVGGDLLVPGDEGQQQMPLHVEGSLKYLEQIVDWTADSGAPARSVRKYESAGATLKVDDQASQRTLPDEQQWVLAEIRDGESSLAGTAHPLTREQYDLINVVASSLAIDRLLPGREVAEGESWRHDSDTLKALLGMDHVAVCDVESVLTERVDNAVKIRLAGMVDGTIDGTPTEMELRCAYLFDLESKQVTQLTIAVKELRKSSELVPGVNVVAKARVQRTPRSTHLEIPKSVQKSAQAISKPLSRDLVFDSTTEGFRFRYDRAWYVTSENRSLLLFSYLYNHKLAAHCNVAVLPARSSGRHTTLDDFEREVRESLGDKLQTVSASTQWKTPQGYHCLGVIANGTVDGVPIQWRNYLVAADDRPRLSLAVTLEQSQGEKFADAERQLIDTLELLPIATAAKSDGGERQTK